MEWMINTQLGRRNLPPQQRIAVVKKFEKKIQDQAKAKLVESGKLYGENHPKDKSLSPNGETLCPEITYIPCFKVLENFRVPIFKNVHNGHNTASL